jgi:hypothetical protein
MQEVKNFRSLSGAALAMAAAGLFLSGAAHVAAAESSEAKVQCHGVNACKGKSECGTARNSCHGQNACKGQGWVTMSAQDCTAKGGKVQKG